MLLSECLNEDLWKRKLNRRLMDVMIHLVIESVRNYQSYSGLSFWCSECVSILAELNQTTADTLVWY